jgi:hypothetical protein
MRLEILVGLNHTVGQLDAQGAPGPASAPRGPRLAQTLVETAFGPLVAP